MRYQGLLKKKKLYFVTNSTDSNKDIKGLPKASPQNMLLFVTKTAI